jgi:hypothetical protein
MITAIAPALPLHTAGKYVAAAYIVLLLLVVVYAAVLGVRVAGMQREIAALADAEEQEDQ